MVFYFLHFQVLSVYFSSFLRLCCESLTKDPKFETVCMQSTMLAIVKEKENVLKIDVVCRLVLCRKTEEVLLFLFCV